MAGPPWLTARSKTAVVLKTSSRLFIFNLTQPINRVLCFFICRYHLPFQSFAFVGFFFGLMVLLTGLVGEHLLLLFFALWLLLKSA